MSNKGSSRAMTLIALDVEQKKSSYMISKDAPGKLILKVKFVLENIAD